MYPIYFACRIWEKLLKGRRVVFHSDNSGTVDVWRAGTSRKCAVMEIVPRIHFVACHMNFDVKISDIAGADNGIADALSRFQGERFRQLAPDAQPVGATQPDLLTPLKPYLTPSSPQTLLPLTTSSVPEWLLLPEELTAMESAALRSFATG